MSFTSLLFEAALVADLAQQESPDLLVVLEEPLCQGHRRTRPSQCHVDLRERQDTREGGVVDPRNRLLLLRPPRVVADCAHFGLPSLTGRSRYAQRDAPGPSPLAAEHRCLQTANWKVMASRAVRVSDLILRPLRARSSSPTVVPWSTQVGTSWSCRPRPGPQPLGRLGVLGTTNWSLGGRKGSAHEPKESPYVENAIGCPGGRGGLPLPLGARPACAVRQEPMRVPAHR